VRARIAARRQRRVLAPRGGIERLCDARVGVGDLLEAHGICERLDAKQHVVVSEPHARIGRLGRRIEREPPALVARLHLYVVAIGSAEVLPRPVCAQLPGRAPPALTVELVQHGAPPVALRRRRCGSGEIDAKGRVVAGRKLPDAPRGHGVRESAECQIAARDGPEGAGQAREEHEEQQRERHCEEQCTSGEPERGTCGGGGRGNDRERPAAQPGLQTVERCTHELLTVETGGEQQEESRADHDELIARCARLEQLEARHQEQQRRAGGEPVQRVKAHEHERHEREGEQCTRRDAGVAAAAVRAEQTPGDQQQCHRRRPGRHAVGVQQHPTGEDGAGPEQRPPGRTGRFRGRHRGHHGPLPSRPKRASAARQRWRCSGPRSGASCVPGSTRP